MANVKKTIGKVPVWIEEYKSGSTYSKFNIVGMYGSSYISLIDNNTTPPATIGGDGNITVDTEKWGIIADASKYYTFVDKKQDKLTAGTGIEINGENVISVTLDTTVFFVAEVLPESPSEEQKKMICLVPSTETEAQNEYTEYVWVVDDEHPSGYWEEMGKFKANIDLTPYQKKTDETLETDSKEVVGAINELNTNKQNTADNALQTTSKEITGAINEVKESNDFLNRNLGEYGTAISLPMTVGMSGKYIDTDGQEQSNPSMGISAPVSILAGNIYLLQCGAALGTGVSVFSRKATNTYDKVIDYSYTYNEDGTIATATADYDPSLVYTYSYDEESHATITDNEGEVVQELPATHNVTESFYEPLFRTNDASMPKLGYYLLLCTKDMEVVVSAGITDITDKSLLGVRYGIFSSIATNFVGAPGQKVIAQAFAELFAIVQALSDQVDRAGHLKVDVLDMANLPKVCGEEMFVTGDGAPANPPTVPFQEFYDNTNKKFYKAKGVLSDTPTTGDWIALN